MRSALFPLLCGAVVGAAAVHLLREPDAAITETDPARSSAAVSAGERLQADTPQDEAAAAAPTLPPADGMAFRIDALAARGERDPAGALRSALTLDIDAARRLAVERLGETIARRDPAHALAQAALIDDGELQALYLSSAASAWAESDARAALAWLASAVPRSLSAAASASVLDAVALADVDMLLASVDALPAALRPAAQKSAIVALADRDPAAALAAIEALPPGRNRNDVEAAFAERYALTDLDAAVAWARQRDSATLTGAMRGAAVNDFERAVELSLDVLRTDSAPIIPFIESGVGDVARLADRLRPSPDPMLQRQLSRLVNFWSQYDAEAALEWAVANAYTDPALVRLVAGAGGRHRPELAIAAAERAPASLRDVWISGVAGGLAAADVERALVFLESHRGEPSYDSGVANIVRTLAENDPVRAAQILERADDLPAARDVAPRIAVVWAQRDPAAAAAWASGLSDPDVQMGAVMNVAPLYVRTTPDAAVDWLLDLPEGQARDLGLSTAASTTAASSTALAERMLAAIGDDKIRAGAAVSAAVAIGRTDQDAARQFAEKWIPEPQLRRQVEQRLAEERGGTDGSAVFRSGVDIPR